MLFACTLTGVDARTKIETVLRLAKEHPIAEFGVLYSISRGGLDPRYMTNAEIEAFADGVHAARGAGVDARLALHLCGRSVDVFLDGPGSDLWELAQRFDRVQMNFNAQLGRVTAQRIDAMLEMFPRAIPVITQHNENNDAISTGVTNSRHQLLIDASGGRGVRADSWPARVAGKVTGYAGGIGPETIGDDLERALAAAAGAETWIDMEGRIRKDDWFDLEACESVLKIVSARVADLEASRSREPQR